MLTFILSSFFIITIWSLAVNDYIEKRKEEKDRDIKLISTWKKLSEDVYFKRKEMIQEIQVLIEKQCKILNSFFAMKHIHWQDRIVINWHETISMIVEWNWNLVKLIFDNEEFEMSHLSYKQIFEELWFQSTVNKALKNIRDSIDLLEIKMIENKINKIKSSNWKWEFLETFNDAKRLEEITKEANQIREKYKWDFYQNVSNYLENK